MTVLWQLAWEEQVLSCAIYRTAAGMELRLESPHAVVLAVPCGMQPRLVARLERLKATLKRHGWQDAP